METIKVLSPVQDKKIRENLGNSPIFTGKRYTADEIKIAEKENSELYEYSFKFDGLKIAQFTGMKKLAR